jgi:hypothetical protein
MRKHSKQLESRRVLTEARLSHLLLEVDSTVTLDMVRFLIFDCHHTRFNTYLSQLLVLFSPLPNHIDENTLITVLQDAWNCFPHRSLNGRSPAEVLMELA